MRVYLSLLLAVTGQTITSLGQRPTKTASSTAGSVAQIAAVQTNALPYTGSTASNAILVDQAVPVAPTALSAAPAKTQIAQPASPPMKLDAPALATTAASPASGVKKASRTQNGTPDMAAIQEALRKLLSNFDTGSTAPRQVANAAAPAKTLKAVVAGNSGGLVPAGGVGKSQVTSVPQPNLHRRFADAVSAKPLGNAQATAAVRGNAVATKAVAAAPGATAQAFLTAATALPVYGTSAATSSKPTLIMPQKLDDVSTTLLNNTVIPGIAYMNNVPKSLIGSISNETVAMEPGTHSANATSHKSSGGTYQLQSGANVASSNFAFMLAVTAVIFI